MDNIQLLKKEYEIISKLYYKSKNQFRSSILLNRLNELRKQTRLFISDMSQQNKEKLQECSVNLYLSSSSYFTMGHFTKLSMILFGISGRIFGYLECYCIFKDEIEDIFDGL
ncbi:hypothetical protein P3W45_001298 [Vairimorpha bombi]